MQLGLELSTHQRVEAVMGSRVTIHIDFDNLTPADASRSALGLRKRILQESDDVLCEVRRGDDSSQDMGATLVLVLGTGTAIAVARGIEAFLRKTGDIVIVKTEHGQVLARGKAAQELNIPKLISELVKSANR
jgi:hypothetical protein